VHESADGIEKPYHTKDVYIGIPTGFTELDVLTSGLQNSEFIVIGARPSVGKTALALSQVRRESEGKQPNLADLRESGSIEQVTDPLIFLHVNPVPLGSQHFDSLVNEAEALVVEEMGRQLPAHADLCTCEDCLLDIAAYALNNVRPRYRATLLDQVGGGDAAHYPREARRAVTEAILHIEVNPSHGSSVTTHRPNREQIRSIPAKL